MRKQYKISILFFFIFFLFSVQVIGFSINFVRAEDEEEKYLITWDWLTTSVYDNPNDKLMHSIGGEDLKSFENLGIYSQDETGVIFKSRATFGFELNSYLALNVEDCYPDVKFDAIKTFSYLGVAYTWGIIPQYAKIYSITARSVDLGDTFNSQHYTDPLRLTVDIVPTFKNFGGEYLNGVQINSVDHIYEIKVVKMDKVEHGLVGEYEDIYTEQTTQSGEVNVVKLEEDDPGNAQARQGVNNLDLGWETNDITDVRNDITIQNDNYLSDPVGTTYHNSGTGAFDFNVMFSMRPEITYSEQTIHVRRAVLIVDTLWNTYQLHGSVENYDDTRMRSIHVTSPFVHQEYEVTVYFLATVNLDAEVYESALGDPYFVKGDWLWNEEIGGTTDVTIVESDPLGQILDMIMAWLIPIIVIIVIILVIYLGMKIGMPLLMFRLGRKSR